MPISVFFFSSDSPKSFHTPCAMQRADSLRSDTKLSRGFNSNAAGDGWFCSPKLWDNGLGDRFWMVLVMRKTCVGKFWYTKSGSSKSFNSFGHHGPWGHGVTARPPTGNFIDDELPPSTYQVFYFWPLGMGESVETQETAHGHFSISKNQIASQFLHW